MDLATIIGFFIAWGAFFGSIALEGGDVKAFLNVSAIVLVFGGTFGATMMSFPLDAMMKLPQITKNAFMGGAMDLGKTIQLLVMFAERARREGLLALEEQARDIDDPFLQKGVQLAVDGTDPELVRAILETEIAYVQERHALGANIFATMGGFAPTLGVIGTVAGLVHMLANLSDPGAMGPAIASAFIATLFGVSSANLVYLPLANKLKSKSSVEILLREIMLEGILSIQAGDNPRVVEEKLKAFLDPAARSKVSPNPVEA